MIRAFRSALVIVSLFAAASFATACANYSPTDIVQADEEEPGDGYHNNN